MVGACAGAPFGPRAVQAEVTEPLSVETQGGLAHFSVEVAGTPEARRIGLMFRRVLAPDAGMLFLFGRDRQLSFWMKNTYLSLDMIFINSSGTIVAIETDTVPLSETPIDPGVKASAVLELNAGTAQRLGIALGHHVRHRAFGSEP